VTVVRKAEALALVSGVFSSGMPIYAKCLGDRIRRLAFGGTLGNLLAQL
jgi:hypothetical protein